MALLEDVEDVPMEEQTNLRPNSVEKDASQAANGHDENDKPNDEGGSDDDENEEEYEIEAILDAKRGLLHKGQMAYLVKWKGYGEEHNSYVTEEDAGNAKELIEEFHKSKAKSRAKSSVAAVKTPSGRGRSSVSARTDDDDALSSTQKRGRGKPLKDSSEPPSENGAGSKRKRAHSDVDVDMGQGEIPSDGVDRDGTHYARIKKKRAGLKDWENYVKKIETVESGKNGLIVFFTTVDGENYIESEKVCRQKFPQKLIDFFVSHLRWKAVDETTAD